MTNRFGTETEVRWTKFGGQKVNKRHLTHWPHVYIISSGELLTGEILLGRGGGSVREATGKVIVNPILDVTTSSRPFWLQSVSRLGGGIRRLRPPPP